MRKNIVVSVLDWTSAKRITVELRKALRLSSESGSPVDAEVFEPPEAHQLGPYSEVMVARLSSVWFSEAALFHLGSDSLERIPYDSIERVEWVSPDSEQKLALKKQRGDWFYIFHRQGCIVVKGLGNWGIQPMHSFLSWVVQRNSSHLSIDAAPA